jgi:hypothetical protein
MLETVEAVRDLVQSSRPEPLSRGYPSSVRRQVGVWLRAQRDAGALWSRLGRQLGISATSASNWARALAAPEEDRASFLPVQVIEDPSSTPTNTRPVLWTPTGYRVEGLDPQLLLQLLRNLE